MNNLNIKDLCNKIRFDVLEAMIYLGMEYDRAARMPDILIINDINNGEYALSANPGEGVMGGYDHENNKVLIPKSSFNDPEILYQVLCHELCHSWQGSRKLLLDLAQPNYYFRETEKEAFMVGSFMCGKMFHGKTLSTLSRDKIISNMTGVWHDLQVKSLLG